MRQRREGPLCSTHIGVLTAYSDKIYIKLKGNLLSTIYRYLEHVVNSPLKESGNNGLMILKLIDG